MLWIASIGGGHPGRNSVGGRFTMTVSMMLFLTTATSGMYHSFVAASHHPHRMAPLVTAMMVSFAA
jgi:hypothetical protein